MRIFASRVLKLRLFGNLFGIGWGNAGSPCVRQGKRAIRHHILLPFVFVLVKDGADRTTESAAPPKPSSPTPRHGYQQIFATYYGVGLKLTVSVVRAAAGRPFME